CRGAQRAGSVALMRRLLAISLSLVLGGGLGLGATAAPPAAAAGPASAGRVAPARHAVSPPTQVAGSVLRVAAPAMQDGVATWSAPLAGGGGTTTSPRIDTAPCTLAALSGDATTTRPHHLELRVREGSAWGAWFDLAVDATPSPDGRLATEPFIADGSTS